MLEGARGILLDWDGCIAIGNRVLPAARTLIAEHRERIAIVSNNSTHLPADFEELLAQQGISLPRERIFLAGAEAIRQIASRSATRVLMLSAPRMRDYAREMGVTLARHRAGLVLLMRDAGFTYAKLALAANALRSGAKLVVANADLTHPAPDDGIMPETGALLAALLACTTETDEVSREIIGKPSPLLFERACAVLGVAPDETVMVGDNPATDGEGALNAGIRPILVGGRSPVRLEHLVGAPTG